MTSPNVQSLFRDHVAERQTKLESALSETGFDALVVASGAPHTYFADDQDAPFHESAHFAHWCPLEGPHHLLHLAPGRRPRLVRHAPEDYWYEPARLGTPFWLDSFDVVEARSPEDVWEELGSLDHAAYVGDDPARAEEAGLAASPEGLVARLDWDRGYKSDYELSRLDEASALGAEGHGAALAAFEAGASELEIHHAFVQALGTTDERLPYHTIIALDEKAAFLHYESKRSVGDGRVLLIDAGASSFGYASDITRTHVRSGCDLRFTSLRDGMETLQRALCEAVRPGIGFGELHHEAHVKIASLLRESGLVRADPEAIVAKGYSRAFFPHGLGHHLGLQVHDVGGHLAGPDGRKAPPPDAHPYLRNTRAVEPRHVFTVEPGLYFIEMLLRPFREGPEADRFDWKLIDELAPLGGIRIEDDVVVTDDGHRNLTRRYLP